MISIQFLINIFKDTKAVQILFFFLAVSILQVLDLFLSIYLSTIFGEYLIMAIICSVSLLGLFLSVTRVKNLIILINKNCENGEFPENYFFQITGVFLAALLIFVPGFLSAIMGFLLLMPLTSVTWGKRISLKTSTDWHTVYEYMKI